MPNRTAQEQLAADPTYIGALMQHTTEEMQRYEEMKNQNQQTRHLIEAHVELDKQQHHAMTRDIAEVKKTVAELAAGMASTTDRLTTAINNQVEIARGQSALINELSGALLKTEDGKIDAYGHNQYHARSVISARRREKIRDGVTQGVVIALVVGVLLWVGNVLWSAALMGPKD